MATEFLTVTPERAEELVLELCQEDADECRLMGHEPRDAVMHSLRESALVAAIVHNQVLLGVVGLEASSYERHLANRRSFVQPWFLTTRASRRYPLALFRAALRWIYAMGSVPMRQLVDARHARAIRFAKRLGFVEVLGQDIPAGTLLLERGAA